jgi:hypothetical protein
MTCCWFAPANARSNIRKTTVATSEDAGLLRVMTREDLLKPHTHQEREDDVRYESFASPKLASTKLLQSRIPSAETSESAMNATASSWLSGASPSVVSSV